MLSAPWETPSSLSLLGRTKGGFSVTCHPILTISFIKRESFEPNLKSRIKVVYLPIPKWELVPQKRGTFKYPPSHPGEAIHSFSAENQRLRLSAANCQQLHTSGSSVKVSLLKLTSSASSWLLKNSVHKSCKHSQVYQ